MKIQDGEVEIIVERVEAVSVNDYENNYETAAVLLSIRSDVVNTSVKLSQRQSVRLVEALMMEMI